MASATQTVAIIGGLILAVAVGGGAAYFILQKPETKIVEAQAPSAPPPSTVETPAPPTPKPPEVKPDLPPPPAAGTPSASDFPTLSFDPIDENFTVTKPTAAYVAASLNSPQMYPLDVGIGVHATQKSKDGGWVIAVTEDAQAAFVPTGALGPYQSNAQSAVPQLDEAVNGHAQVVDTATLDVDGQRIVLFGLTGQTGVLADQLQSAIDGAGSQVSCQVKGQAYQCTLPNIGDLGRFVLFNGGALPGPDATDDYRAQSAAAKSAHKGLFR